MPQCPNCKAEVGPGFKFCKQCGTPLKASAETEVAEAPRPEPSGGRIFHSEGLAGRRKTVGGRAWWLIPLVVVLILVVGTGLFFFGGETIRSY